MIKISCYGNMPITRNLVAKPRWSDIYIIFIKKLFNLLAAHIFNNLPLTLGAAVQQSFVVLKCDVSKAIIIVMLDHAVFSDQSLLHFAY